MIRIKIIFMTEPQRLRVVRRTVFSSGRANITMPGKKELRSMQTRIHP